MDLNLRIDLTRLEDACADQPEQREYFGRLLADAIKAEDIAKSKLGLTKARIDKDVRDHPELYKIEKKTETIIEMAVVRSDKVQQAESDYIEAKHKKNLIEAAVEGLVDRKKSLTNLVELHGQEYFSSVNRERRSEKEQEEEGRDMPQGVKPRNRNAN